MSKKRNYIDFDDPAICSLYVLQKPENRDSFLDKAITYLNQHKFNDDQFIRFIQLLKISDVLLNDEGIINQDNISKLKNILRMFNFKDIQREKINDILRDINILNNIKTDNVSDEISNQVLYDYIGYYNFKLLKLLLNYENYINDDSINDSNFVHKFEIFILQISKIIQLLLKRNSEENNGLDLSKLNSVKYKIIDRNLVKKFNFKEAISLWKYAGAQIKTVSGKYVIDGWTEYEVDFAISRDNSQSNRLLQYNLALLSNNLKVKIYSILRGIAELWNIDIPKLKNIEDESEINIQILSKEVVNLLQQKINDVELYKWIILLEKVRQKYIRDFNSKDIKDIKNFKFNKFFREIDISKISEFTGLPADEIKIIFSNLLMSYEHNNDFFDTPIIKCNEKYYTFALAWLIIDPINIINNVMKRKEFRDSLKTFHEIGRNLESELGDKLQNYEYGSIFKVKKNEKHKDREVDLIVKDDFYDESVLIECKTFNVPSSIKDYAFQLDKIISDHHISKAKKNFETLKRKGDVKSFLEHTNIHELYLTNITIPKSYIHNFNKNNILCVPYFTFYKLLNTPKKFLNLEFNNLLGWLKLKNYDFAIPVPLASFDKNETIKLDSQNILSNLEILNKSQPKTKIYLNKKII